MAYGRTAERQEVSGPGFSRAVNAQSRNEGYGLQPVHESRKIRWASAPEGMRNRRSGAPSIERFLLDGWESTPPLRAKSESAAVDPTPGGYRITFSAPLNSPSKSPASAASLATACSIAFSAAGRW